MANLNVDSILEGIIIDGGYVADCIRYHDTGSNIVASFTNQEDFIRLTTGPQRIGYARANLLGAILRKIEIPGKPLLGYPYTASFQILLGE